MINGKIGSLNLRGVEFNQAVFDYIRNHQSIQQVFLIGYWTTYRERAQGLGQPDTLLDKALLLTVKQLISAGKEPWVILDVPHQPFGIPQALMRSTTMGTVLTPYLAKPSAAFSRDGFAPETLEAIRQAGGHILDPKPLFLSPDGSHYIVQSHGILLYWDDSHLTTNGSMFMLRPFLEKELKLNKPIEKGITDSSTINSQTIDHPTP